MKAIQDAITAGTIPPQTDRQILAEVTRSTNRARIAGVSRNLAGTGNLDSGRSQPDLGYCIREQLQDLKRQHALEKRSKENSISTPGGPSSSSPAPSSTPLCLGNCYTSTFDLETSQSGEQEDNGSDDGNQEYGVDIYDDDNLDAGNPLFLQANDHYNLPIVRFKLTRSNLLARDPLPDVKDAFAIVSREESYRGLAPGKLSAKSPVAFFVRTNNGNNNFNKRIHANNNNSRGPNPNLVYKLCGLIRHDIKSLKLTENVVLFDVLVVPEYNASLLSVNKMTKDSKYFVGFDDCKCYIQDLKLGKIVGIGSESNGIYMFDCDNSGKSSSCLCNSGFVCYVFKELWNCKLGHPSDQVLFVLSDKVGFKSNDHVSACDICHKAKQTMDPFPLSDHKSSKLGDLVHLDVWDPYKVTSKDEYKYFLIVVDDFSRVVWIHLPKTKVGVFDCIESFLNMVYT
nr:ribonuclease H-like domain-containing protein [Tanacetum cinerariifolium]